ncbi:C69 family dipeptidase [Streptococcus ovuberis]|uniref:Dipeptidase n=1 Tax=Streptococcus ovuberis TaxID=1936207 RepID=A0A7X6MZW9_9STRE|nr:C69 family dipeptidase [Streptococcus ovuberis]NKZ20488.1 C69 family dipeptidase [Streptococcus ovuberis]
MKKKLQKGLCLSLTLLLAFQGLTVEACSAFIIGKGLTEDGSTLYGRTEDYPFPVEMDGEVVTGYHNKNFIVTPAQTYSENDRIEDESNGFTYPRQAQEYKYISAPDASRGTGEGIFDAHGFNEHGVSMSATVTAIPNEKVLSVDPLVKNGLAEAIMTSLILPRVKTAREGIEYVAKVIDEKGSAEGNIIMIADQNELWYMEILSGHQYVAIKFPEDKYAVFPNTYFLGHVDLTDKENVIASKDVEKVAKEAGSYKEVGGKFHIAKSYGPENYAEGDRSRVYAGIKLLDPDADVTYDDETFDLLRTPSDPNKKFSIKDAMAIQRNRFEHLPEFKPNDLLPRNEKGRRGSGDAKEEAVYKYPLGNENVIDAHIYQIKPELPKEFGGIVWLNLGTSRNTPYIPFYGNITETYKAFHPQTLEYDKTSWYWVAKHIDEMTMDHPELFGTETLKYFQGLEEGMITHQAEQDKHYATANLSAEEASQEVTEDSLKRSEELFNKMGTLEEEMMAKLPKEETKKEEHVQTAAKETSKSASKPSVALILGVVLVTGLLGYYFFRKRGN